MCKLQRIIHAAPIDGIERIDARYAGSFYSMHRHDSYAIGMTLSGIQSFHRRGALRHSQPGNSIIIHPDELHDGAAGNDTTLHYRMLYLPPELLLQVSPGRQGLPFINNPVLADRNLQFLLASALHDLDSASGELIQEDLLVRLHDTLWQHADQPRRQTLRLDQHAMQNCRDYLCDNSDLTVSSQQLEAITGLDRFQIARQFRLAFGTSPHRYLIMRRLHRARQMIRAGQSSLASIAAACGFADQSHLTRQFKQTFGMTPGRWIDMTAAPRPASGR